MDGGQVVCELDEVTDGELSIALSEARGDVRRRAGRGMPPRRDRDELMTGR
ncbi:hypothetical protein [Clavibacter tessellarius]|uniref:hypothetical protein n=1 Tax=Clavibacter tessellarius TaxID=31965 RepID=UPI0032479618